MLTRFEIIEEPNELPEYIKKYHQSSSYMDVNNLM